MLHELLLSLLGYTGDLIVDEREVEDLVGVRLSSQTTLSEECTFKLAPDISFLQPNERDSVNKLITLGFYYRELDRFSTRSRDLSWVRSPFTSPVSTTFVKGQSVYRRAISNGVVEILSVYRSSVLHVEQTLLSDPVPVLSTVTKALHKFFIILPPLYDVILEIENGDMRGGKILSLLQKRCHCGVPELQSCIQRLLWHGNQLLYIQLQSWMVYGIVQDNNHDEFFITGKESKNMSSPPSSSSSMDSNDWNSSFHIHLDMLPEYIHMNTAESILFTGKAIRVLRNPRCSDDEDKELLPPSSVKEIERVLQNLKESSCFHKRTFESSVNTIRSIAARHLLELIVVRSNLNGHLNALKDYFLLAKGDFFQCFIEESRSVTQKNQTPDLIIAFRLAATKMITDEDTYFSRVSLKVDSGKRTNSSESVWDDVTLDYSVDWPLQLFFTEEVLSRYCKLFRYLMRLKQTQIELEKSWASAMRTDHSFTPMWNVREHMSFLIRNLLFYIQVDVIESQWNRLRRRVNESHDFTDIVEFHHEYVSALVSQSFLDIGSVSRILESIMKLCIRFCSSIQNGDSHGQCRSNDLVEEFDKKSNSLYTILRSSRLAGTPRAPFLRQFLLRLNFNSFFEATARGVALNFSRVLNRD